MYLSTGTRTEARHTPGTSVSQLHDGRQILVATPSCRHFLIREFLSWAPSAPNHPNTEGLGIQTVFRGRYSCVLGSLHLPWERMVARRIPVVSNWVPDYGWL